MDCSFSTEASVCGPFGFNSHILPFEVCKNDLTSHLAGLGISAKRGWQRSTTSEKELILNRAGFFNQPPERPQ